MARLSREIQSVQIDAAFIGIGENGHIAFNDPPADFETTIPYLRVKLDDICRHQQYGEGWFPTMDAVPQYAVTMSCREIMRASAIVCTVPDMRKAKAVAAALEGPVTNLVPASLLQTHPNCGMFLDAAAASLLKDNGNATA